MNWSEPAFGLPIIDVLRAQYANEQKFVLRHPQPAVLVRPQRGSLAAEAIFGVYPPGSANAHFERGYQDVFDPEIMECGPEACRASLGEPTPPLGLLKLRAATGCPAPSVSWFTRINDCWPDIESST